VRLAIRDRFRLFFRGTAKELALAASHARELRRYRDGMNDLAEFVATPFRPINMRQYTLVDSELLLRVIERIYGVDHPWAVAHRAGMRANREAHEQQVRARADDSGEFPKQSSN
jgi:hypothetical protein